MAPKSRWLVGSSSISRSGASTRLWANAARRSCPPDRDPSRAEGRKSKGPITISTK